MALQASCWHLVQHTRLTVVDRGRVVAPTRGRVCGAVQAMASPMGCVGPPPGRQASARQGHLRVPLSAAPRRRPRSVVMVRWRTRQWCALRRSSGYLRASRALRHQRMARQAPMMPLSFSSNCGGPMPARDASPQTVCWWMPGAGSCGGDHTTKTNYVVCAHCHRWVFGLVAVAWAFRVHDLQCTGVWQHTVCGFHPVSLSSSVPEVIVCALAGDIRPGKKCVDHVCMLMHARALMKTRGNPDRGTLS